MIAPRHLWESTRKDKWPGFGVQKITSQAIGEELGLESELVKTVIEIGFDHLCRKAWESKRP
jgi:hypothetical protein